MKLSFNEKIAYIYALCDPRTMVVRYIGKANNLDARLKSHLREASRRDYPLHRWIRKLLAEGVTPTIHLLETCVDWREAERRWIAQAMVRKANILNVADGGEQPPIRPLASLQASHKAMMAKRPRHIMRAYRSMERDQITTKAFSTHEAWGRRNRIYLKFKEAVAAHRKAGTLHVLDEALRLKFERNPQVWSA